ncbi:MAG: Thioredoxin reductase [Pelotomaculum thermopropionicum]|uniref:Thioredoxin reductase n=1 Tax=Pelotomaculum thermopropionicum TaxID=110500 RepID=A0A101HUJ9_9FIRM|nr:MAG: Thioredoxin reductase [Pelotomaculum thermopropionicum]
MEKREMVIIGGGPAGLAAGIYASRADVDTVLLERGIPGGLVINTENIENYPGFSNGINGYELMTQMEDQARRFGLELYNKNADFIIPAEDDYIIKTGESEILTKTVIIATGATPRQLGVPGESKYTGRGVSYCATCDGAFFRNRKVAVIGGGDAAVEEAIFLTRFVEKAYLIHRRGELRATKFVQKKAFNNPKIEFVWHNIAEEIHGTDTVDSLTLKDVRTGDKKNLDIDGVFIYIGYQPNSQLVREIVALDDKGYIITDENMLTSLSGLYAAGDIRKKLLRQVITAVADGAIAAVAAEKYIEDFFR